MHHHRTHPHRTANVASRTEHAPFGLFREFGAVHQILARERAQILL
jgi:hypothetical protein